MADYRQIHTKCWRKDEWFLDLPPLDKLLFIYLFSNEAASCSGLYEMLPLKAIAFETGIEQEYIEQALQRFEDDGKIALSDGWIWVKNLRKYNASNSPTVQKRIERDLNDMPDGELKSLYIRYYMVSVSSDTVSVSSREHEQEIEQKEQEQEQDISAARGADAPPASPDPPEKPAKPSRKPRPPPLTPGAQEFMRLMDAKRLNTGQRESLLALEAEYPENFIECANWVADKNPGLGKGITMMKTALPDWGKKKKIKRGGDGRPLPDEPAGFAGLREVAEKHGLEIEGLTR